MGDEKKAIYSLNIYMCLSLNCRSSVDIYFSYSSGLTRSKFHNFFRPFAFDHCRKLPRKRPGRLLKNHLGWALIKNPSGVGAY